ERLRASQIMQERSLKNPKINFVWDSVVEEKIEESNVTGIRSKNLKTRKEQLLKTDGVFVAIGYEPNTSIFKGQIDLDPKGYIITRNETETNVSGVFAAGEVRDFRIRQAVHTEADG